MKQDQIIRFFVKLLDNLHIPFHIINGETSNFDNIDLGLRSILIKTFDVLTDKNKFMNICKANTLYYTMDSYYCNYTFLKLPGSDSYLIIGPYTYENITHECFLDYASKLQFPAIVMPELEKYYQELHFVTNESELETILLTFSEEIWEGNDNFCVKYLKEPFEKKNYSINEAKIGNYVSQNKLLEERYAAENRLMQAVSQGNQKKASQLWESFPMKGFIQRNPDPLRDKKNYLIILNTLLRKAVEVANVHPMYINEISTKFVKRIELLTSLTASTSLSHEMIYKYCLLVKNHSLKGYSLLVQKALTHIDWDLTADLSLKAIADLLNINASYLSTLFKKETGQTLTDYVNKKRINYAIFLLNSTQLQIQTIAQLSGIPDLNYFSKLFKKIVQKTPSEYRDSITRK